MYKVRAQFIFGPPGGIFMIKILIGVVIVAIGVITTLLVLDPANAASSAGNVTEVAQTFTVVVEGEVYASGSYTMKDGALMSDLIEAAGGLTSNADERAFYEDAVLTKGTTYFIASKYDVNDLCSTSEVEKVNVNSDDAETLTQVNGITSALANSIVTYRSENGLFSTLEQLQEVYGIGPSTYRKIRNYVILHE